MSKLLYVTCNLKPEGQSRSLTVGAAFLDEYRRRHAQDEIQRLDLYRDDIPRIDADVLSGWGKLRTQGVLTAEEQRKLDRIEALADQFIAADKCIFVTPMWNLGFPAELKIYIDTICIVGKAFHYTPVGAQGLLKNQGRKCLHIHSTGGFHYGKEEDHSTPYLKAVMSFMGIEDYEAIVLEGVDAQPEQAETLQRHAIQQAVEVAARF